MASRSTEKTSGRPSGPASPGTGAGANPHGSQSAQPEPLELELLDDPAVPDDHVRAGAPVDADPGPPLDGGDGAAEDLVGLHHLDRQAGAGQVAGGDEPVVARADDDGVDRGVAGVGNRDQSLGAGGASGSRAPRMAKGRASPGKW